MLIRLLKSLPLGIFIFLSINYIDKEFFYDYHGIVRSDLIGFYFYPLSIIADLVNLLIPISETLIYKTILNPIYFSFEQISSGKINPIRISTLILGASWTMLLSYIYLSIKAFTKTPRALHLALFILLLIGITFIISLISVTIFGTPYSRVCPGCA